MSDVASLELCQELYEVSAWEDTDKSWYLITRSTHKMGEWEDLGGQPEYKALSLEQFPTFNWERKSDMACHSEWKFPAYDLGYLLRKLPDSIPYETENHTRNKSLKLWKNRNSFTAGYAGFKEFSTETPEDALCQLAIELFKAGVLK